MIFRLTEWVICLSLYGLTLAWPETSVVTDSLTTDGTRRYTCSLAVTDNLEGVPPNDKRTPLIVDQTELEQKIRDMLTLHHNTSHGGDGRLEECLTPYFRVNSECFYIHTEPKMNWEKARRFCRQLKGDLAEPESLEFLLAVLLNKPEIKESYFWLGASDIEEEGTWKWLSGLPVNHEEVPWIGGQPNNDGGNQNCLELRKNQYPSVNDRNCDDLRAFICEQHHY